MLLGRMQQPGPKNIAEKAPNGILGGLVCSRARSDYDVEIGESEYQRCDTRYCAHGLRGCE